MTQELHRRGVCGDSVIHEWHCDCDICEDDFDFKVQRDSTVDGEVISRVFDDWNDATAAMTALQDAAIEADAEPGWEAGLHVHVAEPPTPIARTRAFMAFVRWENAFTTLAQGRFDAMREMNRSVNDDLYRYVRDAGLSGRPATYIKEAIAQAADGEHEAAVNLLNAHVGSDRHSNLCVHTRFRTWEFRLWNSTRSAWRMELACRMAVAFRHAGFVDALLTFDRRTLRPSDLLDIIATEWQGDDRLAALVDRQVSYLPRAHEAPARFLVA